MTALTGPCERELAVRAGETAEEGRVPAFGGGGPTAGAGRLSARPLLAGAIALGCVGLTAGLCLAMPFWGDQALFTLYAREMVGGAVLYRDVFDVKQPGIFMFYAAGGLLFGFTEIGLHVFELVYWLGFSAFVVVALRPYFTTPWGAPLVPVFTIVVYYGYAGLLDLGQVEILVSFPLLVAWWLIDRADPRTAQGVRRYAAAGFMAAAVVLLKHLYLLIILAFVGFAVMRGYREGMSGSDVRRAGTAFLTTLLTPLLLVAAYFIVHGQTARIWWAYFEMAPAAQLLTPRPFEYLVAGGRRFLIGHAPLLILVAAACVHTWRTRRRPQCDLVAGMALWGVSGAVAFFVLQGWPEYKWPLFTVPIGILAVAGLEALAAEWRTLSHASRRLAWMAGAALGTLSLIIGAEAPRAQTRLLVFVVAGIAAAAAAMGLARHARARRQALLLVPAALGAAMGLAVLAPVQKVRLLMAHDFALTTEARLEYQRAWNHAYRAADEDLDRLRSGEVLPGPLYVFGDPVLLLRANRPQAVPILGWGPEFLDGRAWRELHADLRAAMPPYIVVAGGDVESTIRLRYPDVLAWIQSTYDVAFVGASGTWYVRP
jgi:hypothetical protein